MKKLFLSFLALIIVAAGYAQSMLVATLTHEGNVSMYYGSAALIQALSAAEHGDLINLSGGTFQLLEITKAVTIRGTGIDADNPTYIVCSSGDNSYIHINIENDVTERLMMEGVKVLNGIQMDNNCNNAFLKKCIFNLFTTSNNSALKNWTFLNCKITENIYLYGDSNVSFVNCYVFGYLTSSTTASANFSHCFLKKTRNYWNELNNANFEDCIFYTEYNSSIQNYSAFQLPNTSSATNCLSVGNQYLFNGLYMAKGCATIPDNASDAEIFKTYRGTHFDTETFELTDSAKVTYLGTDSTEIGMHGGAYPYNTTPSYPLISNMSVSAKTTGMLNVDIEISNPQP